MNNMVRKSRVTSRKPKARHVVKDSSGDDVIVRSKLEIKLADCLTQSGSDWQYEVTKVKYSVPESEHTYTADFTLPNNILLEGKGILADYEERRKYVLLKQQNPDIDLRFVFDDPNKKCSGMKMTHAEYAIKYGFPYCSVNDKATIQSWVKETK